MRLYDVLKLIGIFLVAVTNGIIIVILLRFSIISFAEGGSPNRYINQPGTISDTNDHDVLKDVHSQTIRNIEQIARKSALLIQRQQSTDSTTMESISQPVVHNTTYHTTNHTTEEITYITPAPSTDTIDATKTLTFAGGLDLMDDTVRLKVNADHFMIDGSGLSLVDDPQLWKVDDSLLYEHNLLKVNTARISRNELTDTLLIENGGTGATSTAEARIKLGLVANGSGDIWVNRSGDQIAGSLGIRDNLTLGEIGRRTSVTKAGLQSGDEFFIGTTGAFRVQRKYSNSEAFRVQIEGDSQGRLVGTSDGRFRWGDGINPSDISLRRGESGMLWLEGGIVLNNLQQNNDVVIKGTSDSNLLYAHSSLNRISIGSSSATDGKLQLTVNGETGLYIANAGTSDSIRDDSGARLTADGIWTDASDKNKKTSIDDLSYGLDELMQLRPVQYQWRETQQKDIGFIAQEVMSILPELVFGTNGNMSLSYGHLTALLTKSIQEQHDIITDLSDQLAQIKSRIQQIEDNQSQLNEQLSSPIPASVEDVSSAPTGSSESMDDISPAASSEGGIDITHVDKLDTPLETDSSTKRIVERGINVSINPEQQSIEIAFPEPRPTATYAVSVTPTWLTHFAVTSKSAEGFTIAFSEAPTSNAALDWVIIE